MPQSDVMGYVMGYVMSLGEGEGGERTGDSPLALAGVLAIIAEVDGAGAAGRQQGIIGCQDGTPQNLQVLLVAGHAHPHMVGQPHLQPHEAHGNRPELTRGHGSRSVVAMNCPGNMSEALE